MINEELIKKHEKIANEIADKISYLDSCMEDLKNCITRWWDVENKFPADALNELLKAGLLPNAVIEMRRDQKRYVLNGYTATDYADFSPLEDKETHICQSLISLAKNRDAWFIVQEAKVLKEAE
jgi:hypothetical protein